MCYDLSFSASIESVYDYLPELKDLGQLDMYFEPTFHKVAQAYPKWPVVIADKGQLKLLKFEWGVIPGYMKTPEEIKKGRKWMVNARSEKVLDTKAYWSRIRKNRCLIPATGFFEHREIPGWKPERKEEVRATLFIQFGELFINLKLNQDEIKVPLSDIEKL